MIVLLSPRLLLATISLLLLLTGAPPATHAQPADSPYPGPGGAFAQEVPGPEPLWVARYNGQGNGPDFPRAIALDGQGNVYVTGGSLGSGTGSDYATVKYDAQGNQLWEARYNGPGHGEDHAEAIALDSQGSIYVIGRSVGLGSDTDYATVKYDAQGNQVWVARYNGLGNSWDAALALALDGEGGICVTGKSVGSGTSDDYATVKYDAQGNQIWVARYNGPSNGDDGAHAIALDSQGNLYVTGRSVGGGTGFDYATVKYDPQGNQLWVARYNGLGNATDEALAIALDAQGSLYVSGTSVGSGTGADYATIKYDAQGNELWVARYNQASDGDDKAHAIAADNQGNVYVTGLSLAGGPTYDDSATVKYDPQGNQLWVAAYNGPDNGGDAAHAVALDSHGNLYVTGYSHGSGYATVKYDSQGNQLWVAHYRGPGNGPDFAQAIALDGQGNVYVTGMSWGGDSWYDFATIRYPPPSPAGITSLTTAQDTDGAAGVSLSVPQVYDATTQTPLPGLLIGSHETAFQYNGTLLNVLEVRLKAPFGDNGTTINNPGGNTLFSGVAPGGAPWPVQTAFVALRLTGCTTDAVTLTPTVNSVFDNMGNALQVDQPAAKTFRRGDAKANGAVDMGDALYIAQAVVGSRPIGEGPTEVNAVNAASVKQDGAFDVISAADVLRIAQRAVGQRDDCFNLLPAAIPPHR